MQNCIPLIKNEEPNSYSTLTINHGVTPLRYVQFCLKLHDLLWNIRKVNKPVLQMWHNAPVRHKSLVLGLPQEVFSVSESSLLVSRKLSLCYWYDGSLDGKFCLLAGLTNPEIYASCDQGDWSSDNRLNIHSEQGSDRGWTKNPSQNTGISQW